MNSSQSVYEAGKMAMLGTVIGEIAGVCLLIWFMKKKRPTQNFEKTHVRAWPIIKEVTIIQYKY